MIFYYCNKKASIKLNNRKLKDKDTKFEMYLCNKCWNNKDFD